ncbi:MAG: hypothetical protein ACR2RV_05080 [Verrucomicrobiales bacterium]
MIVSEYLDYRSRLDATMMALADAARRSGAAHAGRPALLRNLMAGVKDPFLFLVAGESGAGKSMFLNALAGDAFCDPCEGAVADFKCGEQPRDVAGGAGRVEKYRPCEFLRDVHVVELPGTAAALEPAAAVGERFVPMADLITVVISVADAWTPGAWKSLDHVHLGHGRETLVILTGCDLRTEEEIAAVLEHMQLTMERRYSQALTIFPMSAENAFLARTNPAAGGEAKLAASGIGDFEAFVSQQVLASDGRMGKLGKVLDAARSVLDELLEPLGETEDILGKDSDLLESLRSEINERYEISDERIRNEFFSDLDGGYGEAVSAAEAELRAATGWGSLPRQVLRGGGKVPPELGKHFQERVTDVTESRVIGAMTEAEGDVGELWTTLSSRVAEDFDHQLTAGDGTGKAVWSGRGEALLRRAEACVAKSCADQNIEEAVGVQLRRNAGALRFFALSAVVLGLASGVLSVMHLEPYNWIVAGLAVVALGFGAGQFLDGRRKLAAVLTECAQAGRIQLRADLNRELSSHVHGYYTKLGTIFDPVQELCQRQAEEAEPQIAAVRALDADVLRLAEELDGTREAARAYLRRREG